METNWIVTLVISVVVFVIGLVIGFFYNKYQVEKKLKEQGQKAEIILQRAKESARSIEMQAKDDALKILKSSEGEITRRRSEMSREEDRLQKRRAELDIRIEKLEQREQALNKRQSAVDKRVNDVEKMYSRTT